MTTDEWEEITPIFWASEGANPDELIEKFFRVAVWVPSPVGVPARDLQEAGRSSWPLEPKEIVRGDQCIVMLDRVGELELRYLPGLAPPKFRNLREYREYLQ